MKFVFSLFCLIQAQTPKRILMTFKNFTHEVNEAYFYLKLRQLIDDMFSSPKKYSIVDQQENYIRLLRICSLSSKAFQHFSQITAKQMIENSFPEAIQKYLDRFIFDMRIRKESIEDFNRTYGDDLYFIVKAISATFDESDEMVEEDTNDSHQLENRVLKDLLNHLRQKDFVRFVVITTHFEQVRHLLHETS